MRVVVVGAGGVGGTIGARLHQAGYDVALVARGAHGAAIGEHGLVFATPEGRVTLQIPTYAHPRELRWDSHDVVLLAVKSQDTETAAQALADAAGQVPVVSAQNGVANERALSRWFAEVHGMCVMLPAAHLEPGVVLAHSARATGILDLGRYPSGVDDLDLRLAEALRASRFECVARPDIMAWKHRKLVMNLGNAVEALAGHDDQDAAARAVALLEAEATAVFAAAGVVPVTAEAERERRADHLARAAVGDEPRPGGSTWQSLRRGTPVETDYLNGEICLLGRLHGVPTPANQRIQSLLRVAASRSAGPGSLTAAELLAELSG